MKKLFAEIICTLFLFFCFGCDSSLSPQWERKLKMSQTRLNNSLTDLFNESWGEEYCRFEELMKKINRAEAQPKNDVSADYLLGYLEGGPEKQTNYLIGEIYTRQKELEHKVLPEELSQPFADFFDARSKFRSRLQGVLRKTRQIPAEEAFQNNTGQALRLSDGLNVHSYDITGGKPMQKFKDTLEQIAKCLDEAFPNSNS